MEDDGPKNVINLSEHFSKRQQLISHLPRLLEIFLKYFPVQVQDQDELKTFLNRLLTDPKLPSLELDDDQFICLDFELRQLARSGAITMSSALYYARLNMEENLSLVMSKNSTVRAYVQKDPSQNDRIARNLFGMMAIAWQIMNDLALVVNKEGLEASRAKQKTPN